MSKGASNLLLIAGLVTGLLFFKGFLIPIALGLFIAAILLYIRKALHLKKRMVLVGWIMILVCVGRGLQLGGSELANSIGELGLSIRETFDMVTANIEARWGISVGSQTPQSIFQQLQGIASSLPIGSFGLGFFSIMIDVLLVVVYSFLFVIYEKKIVNALSTVSPQASKYWNMSIKKSAQYIGSLLIISLILGVLYSIILSVLGVKYAILIAIIAALCTLVPTVGTAIGILGASITTYAVTGSVTPALIVFVSFECIQLLEEYTMLPAIAGKKLEINPLATILSIVLGGILRGVAGVFLVLPVLSIIQEIIEDKNPHHWFIKFTQ